MGAENGQSLSTPLPYSYEPLPGRSYIRLLKRLPNAPDGTPSFSVTLRDLDDDHGMQFHCLSYTWGNPFAHGTPFKDHFAAVAGKYDALQTTPVLVDKGLLHIQKNLLDALLSIPQAAYADDVCRPVRRNGGRSSMHSAAMEGKAGLIEMWIRRGARVGDRDDTGRTPLHYAAKSGHVSCCEVLCRGGALRGVKDKDGMTPLGLARDASHEHVVAMLEALASQPDPESPVILRETDGPEKYIWADAICINQGDMDEKSTQVSMMDRIYIAAAFVVAWLGPEDEHTEAGIKTFATLAAHIEKFKTSNIVPYGGHDQEQYDEVGMPLISWSEWVGLASIYQRQWFRRAWIVQEAVLPGVLLMFIGSQQLSWYEVGNLSEVIRRKEAELGTSRSSIFVPLTDVAVPVGWNTAEVFKWRSNMIRANIARTTHTETVSPQGLFTLKLLAESFWTFLASEPKDKVFALHGILNHASGSTRLETDYRRSISSIYTDAARKMMVETGDLDVLTKCVYSTQRREGLPSWVPDFSLPGVNPIPDIFSADEGLVYQPPIAGAVDDPVLRITGYHVGGITQVAGRLGTSPGDKLRFDPSWLKLALSLRASHREGGKNPVLSEVLWRTLCMNMFSSSFYDAASSGPWAPGEHGGQFMIFMLLMILAGADRKVLLKMGIEPGLGRDLTLSSEAYNPLEDEDLTSTLDDLDALAAHDGDKCCTPSREAVVTLWDSLRYTLSRTVTANADGSPVDINLPDEVVDGGMRVLGNGIVNSGTKLFQKCRTFATAYYNAYGGRQLFTVDSKFLGLGPLQAEAGDEVWILPGMKSPVVLRPAFPKGEHTESAANQMGAVSLMDKHATYRLIGCSYVHGLMHGEATRGNAANLVDIKLV